MTTDKYQLSTYISRRYRISWKRGGGWSHTQTPPPPWTLSARVIRPPKNWKTRPLLDIHKHTPPWTLDIARVPLDITRMTSSTFQGGGGWSAPVSHCHGPCQPRVGCCMGSGKNRGILVGSGRTCAPCVSNYPFFAPISLPTIRTCTSFGEWVDVILAWEQCGCDHDWCRELTRGPVGIWCHCWERRGVLLPWFHKGELISHVPCDWHLMMGRT